MEGPAAVIVAPAEREHLERAHHEICTALTVVCSNIALVRIQLRDVAFTKESVPVHAHLDELDLAVARLHALARELKTWHHGTASGPT